MKKITGVDWLEFSFKEQKNFTGIVKWHSGRKEFFTNGLFHRIDGPAVIRADRFVEYWINGKLVSREAQELYYSLLKLKGLL